MGRPLKYAAGVFLVGIAAAQLIRPQRTNPPIDESRTIQAQVGTASRLNAVLDRSCSGCHSNKTTWPWYTQIAPVSWLIVYAVNEGRNTVNFSEWAAYKPNMQRDLLAGSCQDATTGKMPGKPWTLLHPEARLSAQDIETICAAARKTEADVGH